MERLRGRDLGRLLDEERHDEEEGQRVEAVDVDQLDGRPLHLHRGPLHQGQVATLGEDAQEAVGVSLAVEFLLPNVQIVKLCYDCFLPNRSFLK